VTMSEISSCAVQGNPVNFQTTVFWSGKHFVRLDVVVVFPFALFSGIASISGFAFSSLSEVDRLVGRGPSG
jgi:hypothetical protein